MNKTKPEGLTANEKEYAWSKIDAGLSTSARPLSYLMLWKKTQSKIIAGIVGLLILGGGAATAYASGAKPGDFLFPIEVAKEHAQIFLAKDQKKKDALHIKFAEKRLSQVHELVAVVNASAPVATTGSSTASTTTPTPVISKDLTKKIERANRALTIALLELTETRDALLLAGNTNAALIIDDIIDELNGVGNGSVTITRIATDGKGKSGHVAIRATVTATSSASSTFVGSVRIDEKKNGAKITLNGNTTKTQITVGTDKKNENKKNNDRGDNSSEKHDDEDEGDDDDEDNHRKNNDKRGEKKLNICHVSGSDKHTVNISVNAARAHLAHGDTLGSCGGAVTPPTTDTTSPTLTGVVSTPTETGATVSWSTNEQSSARVWLSSTSPVVTTSTPSAERTSLATTQPLSLGGLTPATVYYFIVSSADAAGNRATSSQGSFTTLALLDTTAPTLSGMSVTLTTTSATLSFTTNENARAQIWRSTTTPIIVSGTPAVDEGSYVSAHSVTLAGLTSSTLYHYVISIVDASGNRATTSAATFTTNVPADTTAPIISNMSVGTTTTTASVGWTTNESTNGTLYFGQSTPVNIATANSIVISAFSTTHSALLSGLTSSSTYRYIIVAHDSAGNTATSSEQSFTLSGS